MELETKDIIAAANPFITGVVNTILAPKLKIILDKLNKKGSNLRLPTEKHFEEYLTRTYVKLSVVNTLVFSNSQKLLDDIYVPLTIKSTNHQKYSHKINGYPKAISDTFNNILITDTAGMGKSTIMKKIFLDIINKQSGIPLFIELRRLTKKHKLIHEIQEQLNSINKKFDQDLLFSLLAEGDFIIILDGYDEIGFEHLEFVTYDIQEFISKASSNRYFITSRPEKAITSFGNFQEFTIEPLKKNEAFSILKKYDNKGVLSTLLIKKLKETGLENINEFLTNPLLVSLLYSSFDHKQTIPFKKYLFYRQVFEANFENHDLTKGDSYIHNKFSNLEIDDFHRVLRHIGYNCLKLQKIEFLKDEILKLIRESKLFCLGLEFNESDFLSDLLKTVPLFIQDGNYIKWAHKSIQEYFAAQFIYQDSDGNRENILKKLYFSNNIDKLQNVIDLYYDMDFKNFNNVIILNLLNEYNDYQKSTFKNYKTGITEQDIILRKELTFLSLNFMFKDIGDSNRFSSDRFSDIVMGMIDEIKRRKNLDSIESVGITITSETPRDYIILNIEFPKKTIFRILHSKKNPLVSLIDSESRNKEIKLDLDLMNEHELHEITDSPSDKVNSSENFKMLNRVFEICTQPPYKINHNEALKQLKSINKNIKLEANSDFFLDGL